MDEAQSREGESCDAALAPAPSRAHAAQSRALYARDPKRFQQRTDASPNRPAVRRAMHERRRARALGAGPSFTAAEWTALVEAYRNVCAYDGAPGPLHVDHRLPLARGGTN